MFLRSASSSIARTKSAVLDNRWWVVCKFKTSFTLVRERRAGSHPHSHHTAPVQLPDRTLPFILISQDFCVQNVMPYFRVTLMRSAIGLPQKTQGVLAALGLRKRMNTVYHEVTPDVAGQIMKVKELVVVSEVEERVTKYEAKESRKSDPGYIIESRPSAAST